MRFRLVAGIIAIGVMAFTGSAGAHHAHGNYARDPIDMEGVITEMHLLQPHSWVYLEVTKNGEKELWALEGSGTMTGKGKSEVNAAVGDKVKVRCQPLSDGSPGCLLGFIKAPNGVVKDWDNIFSTILPKDF